MSGQRYSTISELAGLCRTSFLSVSGIAHTTTRLDSTGQEGKTATAGKLSARVRDRGVGVLQALLSHTCAFSLPRDAFSERSGTKTIRSETLLYRYLSHPDSFVPRKYFTDRPSHAHYTCAALESQSRRRGRGLEASLLPVMWCGNETVYY